ncbi:MAG: molybdenum cofactor guanylyltransferase [Pirellulaceae bacterium]
MQPSKNYSAVAEMRFGGVVLCGGESRRMGRPKALLPFGDETMLQRVVRLLSEVVGPLVAVAAADQVLPQLPETVRIVRDEQPALGPLEGLRVGLSALAGEVDAAYATSCDVPLLAPELVRRMLRELGANHIAVPVEGEFHHPLAAVYRPQVVDAIERLLAAGRRRPVDLYAEVPTARVAVASLREVDPPLHTLRNLNRPEDYLEALRIAGLPTPSRW